MIQELPDGYRTVFNLYVFEKKSHREIAGLLGIREDSSASQYFRARAQLARQIKAYLKEHAAGVVAAAAAVVIGVFLWRTAPSAIPSADVPFGGLLTVPSERLAYVSHPSSGPMRVVAPAAPVASAEPAASMEADTCSTAVAPEEPSPVTKEKTVLPEEPQVSWFEREDGPAGRAAGILV